MSKELEALERIKENCDLFDEGYQWDEAFSDLFSEDIDTIENALKDYEELLKIDCKQNTINDFYPNTKTMIDDLLNLVCTKMCDFLKEGETYTKTRMLELLGTTIRYVKTFAYGREFNENEKMGVNAKKLKALETIKETRVDTNLIKLSKDYDDYCGLEVEKLLTLQHHNLVVEQKGITEEQYNLLKEMLL